MSKNIAVDIDDIDDLLVDSSNNKENKKKPSFLTKYRGSSQALDYDLSPKKNNLLNTFNSDVNFEKNILGNDSFGNINSNITVENNIISPKNEKPIETQSNSLLGNSRRTKVNLLIIKYN